MILIKVHVKYILDILFAMCILYKAYAKMSYFMGFYCGFILNYFITYFTLLSSQCPCPILRSSTTSSDGNVPCHSPAQAARSHGPDGHHSCRSGSRLGRWARGGQCHHRCFQWRQQQQLRGTQTSTHTSGDTYKRTYFSVENCFDESSHKSF